MLHSSLGAKQKLVGKRVEQNVMLHSKINVLFIK